MSSRSILVALVLGIAAAAIPQSAIAAPLSDAQMYFDPASIVDNYYARIVLPDLTTGNQIVFPSPGVVVDADILPTLKQGDYPPGYVFSQADYLFTPNVDYFADITSGTLTVTFNQIGLYHVRVTRMTGPPAIFAVLAGAGIKEKKGSPDKTGATKRVEATDADIFLVEKSDKTIDDSAKVWKKKGKEVKRVTSRADTVKKIKEKSKALGRKIHVELDGHGAAANASTGAGKKDVADKQVDSTSVQAFQEAIDEYVSYITFQHCSVGMGTDGKDFLKILAKSIGCAGAWTGTVTVDDCDFSTGKDTKFINCYDCNSNCTEDSMDISAGATDANSNGTPDVCEDCNTNGTRDDLESQTPGQDTNSNGKPDSCDRDCNSNGTPDDRDISQNQSSDADQNGRPDTCDPDCNTNGTVDLNDISTASSGDCNDNFVPDECDVFTGDSADCNTDDAPDECLDCNTNGTGDACDIANGEPDCEGNGVPDACGATDMNTNLIPDACDIFFSATPDCNTNGIPDVNEVGPVLSMYSRAVGLPILDLQTLVTPPITINDHALISDVNVQIQIMHGRASDLRITLVHDDVAVPLAINPGTTGANFSGTTFDDDAVRPISVGTAPFNGAFVPAPGPLSELYGQDKAGNWWLEISDTVGGLSGNMSSFSLVMMNDVHDLNGNFVPDSCEAIPCGTCRGDLNGDFQHDGDDIQMFVQSIVLGTYIPCADMDGDGVNVNHTDLLMFTSTLLSGPTGCGG